MPLTLKTLAQINVPRAMFWKLHGIQFTEDVLVTYSTAVHSIFQLLSTQKSQKEASLYSPTSPFTKFAFFLKTSRDATEQAKKALV